MKSREAIHEPEDSQARFAESARFDLVRAARDLLHAGRISKEEQEVLERVCEKFDNPEPARSVAPF